MFIECLLIAKHYNNNYGIVISIDCLSMRVNIYAYLCMSISMLIYACQYLCLSMHVNIYAYLCMYWIGWHICVTWKLKTDRTPQGIYQVKCATVHYWQCYGMVHYWQCYGTVHYWQCYGMVHYWQAISEKQIILISCTNTFITVLFGCYLILLRWKATFKLDWTAELPKLISDGTSILNFGITAFMGTQNVPPWKEQMLCKTNSFQINE